MINEIFAPQEANLIKKKIHLSKTAAPDFVFWPQVENGQYSCKSGYHFFKEQKTGSSASVPPDPAQSLWKKKYGLLMFQIR